MTNEEAVKVAGIIKTADGGCRVCIGALAVTFQRYFPEFDWVKLVEDANIKELWSDD